MIDSKYRTLHLNRIRQEMALGKTPKEALALLKKIIARQARSDTDVRKPKIVFRQSTPQQSRK